MKKYLKSFFVIVFVLLFLVSFVGCGNETVNSDNSDDDFFTDDEVQVSRQDDSNPTNQPGDSNVPVNTTSSKKSTQKSTENTGSNKIFGKSWMEVLATMPSSLRGTTVTVFNWNPPEEYTGAPSVIKSFENSTGIKVKWMTENYDTYLSKLASLVASDLAPDIVRTLRPDPIGLQSLQPVSVAKFDFSDDAWDKLLMDVYTYNGKCFGVNLKNTHVGAVTMLLYNKALINKYDLDDPYQLWKNNKWTFNKFLDICREYKRESGAEYACGGQDWCKWSQMYGIPGPVAYNGKKFVSLVSDSKFVQVTQKIADLYNTERLFAYWKADEFNNGDCLFWAGGAVFSRRQNSYFKSLKGAGSLNVVPMPAVDGQNTYYQDMSEYEAFGIAKGAKNAAAVPYFLRYFLDPQNYNLASFFCSVQALEVYNWCMKQTNRVWSLNYGAAFNFYGTPDDGFWSGIKDLAGAQINSFLNSNAAVIQRRVDNYNKAKDSL